MLPEFVRPEPHTHLARSPYLAGLWPVASAAPEALVGAVFGRMGAVEGTVQKGILAGHAASGMVTALLIAAPFVMNRPSASAMLVIDRGAASGDITLPADLARPASAPRAIATVALATPATEAAVVPAALRMPVHVVTRTPGSLAAAPVRLDAVAAVTETSDEQAPADEKRPGRRPFGRRLASLLTGDGAYSVRPFPSIPTER